MRTGLPPSSDSSHIGFKNVKKFCCDPKFQRIALISVPILLTTGVFLVTSAGSILVIAIGWSLIGFGSIEAAYFSTKIFAGRAHVPRDKHTACHPEESKREEPLSAVSLPSSEFSTTRPLPIRGNATADEYLAAITTCRRRFLDDNPDFLNNLNTFLSRGGSLNVIQISDPTKRVIIDPRKKIVVGCSCGANRSQSLAAHLEIQLNRSDIDVLAGGSSAMNPQCAEHILESFDDEQAIFAEAFKGKRKKPQIGLALGLCYINADTTPSIEDAKTFYQNYIDGLPPTHFLTFADAGITVIKRLLNRTGRLEGFEVTFNPIEDEIRYPPEKVPPIDHSSKDAYLSFIERIKPLLEIQMTE